jgi:hypothetical protein
MVAISILRFESFYGQIQQNKKVVIRQDQLEAIILFFS